MENASKALLIAAAILIAIIIIAIGIKVYTSSSETGKVAMNTGEIISSRTKVATDMTKSYINGEEYSPSVKIGSLKENNYGEYIDLGKNIVGTDATTDDWRILYNDESEEKVYVILTELMPNDFENVIVDSGLRKYSNGGIGAYGSNTSEVLNNFFNRIKIRNME